MLTIQRRQSPKSVYMYPRKNVKSLQCPTTKVWYPGLLQARNRFLQIIQMCSMILDAFLVPYTIFKLILLLHPSKTLADQSQCILESFKQEKEKMLQAGGSKAIHQVTPWINSFVLVEGKINLEISSWEYVCILPI